MSCRVRPPSTVRPRPHSTEGAAAQPLGCPQWKVASIHWRCARLAMSSWRCRVSSTDMLSMRAPRWAQSFFLALDSEEDSSRTSSAASDQSGAGLDSLYSWQEVVDCHGVPPCMRCKVCKAASIAVQKVQAGVRSQLPLPASTAAAAFEDFLGAAEMVERTLEQMRTEAYSAQLVGALEQMHTEADEQQNEKTAATFLA